MKRSTVNETIETAKEAFAAIGFTLPPFAFWTVDDWKAKGRECDEIRDSMLGWDVTDFGQDQFEQLGRSLLTLRNGSSKCELEKDNAEKLILDPENQKPPLHFHHHKMEDIINRGGGNILVRLFQSDANGQCSDQDFTIQVDGQTRMHKAGAQLRLEPGQSL